MKTIDIEYLADRPAFVPTVAEWQHRQWGHLTPGSSLDQRIAHLSRSMGRDAIPITFVAVAEDAPRGCASLIHHDLTTRMELSPWLASVYVDPEHRKQGIGSGLVRRAMEKAGELGVERLYLITPDQERFYRRLGWSSLEWTNYRGENVVIMECTPNGQLPPGDVQPIIDADRRG